MIRLNRLFPSLHFPAQFLLAVLLLLVAAVGALPQPSNKDTRAQLEAGKLDLAQIEAALQRENLDDKRLGELRARIDPIAVSIEEIILREQPRADDIKARLEKLGPPPDATKAQTESADVARDRAEQQRNWQEADEVLRLSRALALRVDQVKDAIADRRRQNFSREILKQSASVASPWLWMDAARSLPGDVRAFRFLTGQWAEAIAANFDWYEIVILGLLLAAGIFGVPRAIAWAGTGSFAGKPVKAAPHPDDPEAPRLSRLMIALRSIALATIVPYAGLVLLLRLLEEFDVLPGRVQPVMQAAVDAAAYAFVVFGVARGVLSPTESRRRLAPISDRMAQEFTRMIEIVVVVVALGKVIDALFSAIVASLPLVIATRGVLAVFAALVLARGLRRAFGGAPEVDHAAAPTIGGGLLPFRLFGWCGIAIVVGSALTGFVALSSFMIQQLLALAVLAMGILLATAFIDEVVGVGLAAKGVLGRRIRETTGLTASSLDQFSVLGSGFLRLMAYVFVGIVALAPWGIDSSNLLSSVRAAFFGFQIGGITISLATIGIALASFVVGFFITRVIRNWLDTRYLPHTELDLGLRNSILTIFGYVGTIAAAMFALSQLGLSLEKLTIVAGALSVGIGFGLQSIVNNFVSGLILLWERPIRVGDWIVVGEEQGTVKRINVRATEIETFDRASLIIPNSEFISGRVKNWMHADRTGRIIIPVNVDYEADPDQVQALLRDAALAHREVMSEPKPMVIFKNLGESGMDFELRCFVDVDAMGVARSELLFDIFRRLKEAKISIPYPTRRLEISNVGVPGETAQAIAVAAGRRSE